MRAVILAGGRGTRLAPYTKVFPKPMLPIGDRPILDIIIRQLVRHGFKHIILSVGYLAELIQAYFQTNQRLPKDVDLTFVRERKPLGTAGSLSLIPNLTETFLFMNGDVLTTLDYRKLMEFHKRNKGAATIAMHKIRVEINFGVISTDGNSKILDYDEKPALDSLSSMGIYVLEPRVLKYIVPNKKLNFPELIRILIAKGENVQGYASNDYWKDIGRHAAYEEAVNDFENKKIKLKGIS